MAKFGEVEHQNNEVGNGEGSQDGGTEDRDLPETDRETGIGGANPGASEETEIPEIDDPVLERPIIPMPKKDDEGAEACANCGSFHDGACPADTELSPVPADHGPIKQSARRGMFSGVQLSKYGKK